MAEYSESQSIFAFGPHQTNFQTEVAADDDPKNYRWITKDGYTKATFDSPNVNNAGESTGLALPDETRKDRDTATFSAVEQLTFQLLGIRAYDAFGVAATPTVLSAGAAWRHAFTLLDPHVSPVLPSRPLAEKIAEPAVSGNRILDRKFSSMTYSRFTVTDQTDKPNLSLDSEWQGSGKVTIPSGIQFYGTGRHVWNRGDIAAAHKTPINKRSGLTYFYTAANYGGTEIETECKGRGFTTTINENLNVEGGYAGCALFQDSDPNKGAIAGKMDSSGQAVAWEITQVADSATITALDLHERLKAGTEFSMKQIYTGPIITGIIPHAATFGLKKAVIASIEWLAVDGGTQGFRIVTEPLGVGNSMPLELILDTNVADFATYIAA